MLGIPPTEFWEMGLQELFIALDGYSEANSIDEKPLSKDELEDLMLRFPD